MPFGNPACAFPVSLSPATVRQRYEIDIGLLFVRYKRVKKIPYNLISCIYFHIIKTQTAVPEIGNIWKLKMFYNILISYYQIIIKIWQNNLLYSLIKHQHLINHRVILIIIIWPKMLHIKINNWIYTNCIYLSFNKFLKWYMNIKYL